MIKTRQALKQYLQEDCKANLGTSNINPLKYIVGLIYKQENILVYRYLKILHKREYHLNNKSLFHKIAQLYYRVKQNRLGYYYGIQIHPNTIGNWFNMRYLQGGNRQL